MATIDKKGIVCPNALMPLMKGALTQPFIMFKNHLVTSVICRALPRSWKLSVLALTISCHLENVENEAENEEALLAGSLIPAIEPFNHVLLLKYYYLKQVHRAQLR